MSLALPDYPTYQPDEEALRRALMSRPGVNTIGRTLPTYQGEGPTYTPPPPQIAMNVPSAPPAAQPDYPTYTPPYNAETAERPRLATGTPGEANPMNPYERSQSDLQAAVSAPIEEHSRGANAAYGAVESARNAARSGSLGYTIGAALGGAASGALNKKMLGQAEHDQAVAQAEAAAKVANESAENAAKVRQINAQAANQEALPGYRTAEQQRKDDTEKNRAEDQQRRVLASQFNKADEFDPDDPANADFVAEAQRLHMPVFAKKKGEKATYKQDAKNGRWYVFRGDQSADVKAPDSTAPLATTSPQQMTAAQGELNRQNRLEVAKIMVNSREQIAAQQQAIEKDRVQMSKDQFALRYPGAGKVLKRDAIIDKYNKLKAADPMLTIDKVISDATKQGYTIQD
jgi:hypothetical protein